ncbi:competence protein ComEA [Variovorax paradoxus]|nr:competence protein ComEA [Variovorax paradoxus]
MVTSVVAACRAVNAFFPAFVEREPASCRQTKSTTREFEIMLKKILATLVMLFAAASFAAVDVNKGTAADLDGIKGIGPAMSKRILDARKTGEFKDWPDFMQRIKGVKEKKAEKLSAEGLTVNGQAFGGQASAPAAVKADKAAKPVKAAPVAADAKPAKP